MSTNKTFTQNKKNISYLSKDFNQLKQSLVDFSKYYYPNTYKDFGESSPGMMFIELASYVGDVMAFYADSQVQESILTLATERKNIINEANSAGYKIKNTSPSQVVLDVYQVIPSTVDSNGDTVPNYNYVQTIKEGMSTSTSDGISFITSEIIDFNVDTSISPRELSVFQRDQNGIPQNYILKKSAKAFSANRRAIDVIINAASKYYTINLEESNVICVESMVDSDGQKWYEVDCLAQELVPITVKNSYTNNQNLYLEKSTVPYILKYIRTSNRFITRIDTNNLTSIEFGAGTDELYDEEFLMSPNNLALSSARINSATDPSNVLNTRSYGRAPANTTLTVTYLYGGGVNTNVSANSIINVNSIEFDGDDRDLTADEINTIKAARASIRVTNPSPASGGGDAETDEEIRNNAISHINSQKRAVTAEDYVLRCYSLPTKYGSVAKAFSRKSEFGVNSIDIYVLSYDENKKLTSINSSLSENLKTYLGTYKLMTDSISIVDGNIINVGIDFKISVQTGYLKKEVLSNCIKVVQGFMNIDNWQFNQPIDISRIQMEIGNVDGVQSVMFVKVKNLTKADGNYSLNVYDIAFATQDNIVYPSIDPCIFELKYPSKDVRGEYL
jgi:hypothetical protein